MLKIPLVILAVANADACDHRATVAGELMIHRQRGASVERLAELARRADSASDAAALLPRILAAETASEPAAQELAAFHFAAEIFAECSGAVAAGY